MDAIRSNRDTLETRGTSHQPDRRIRQRQYRLNPKYSLMVKEEIVRLLEAGFIYPVHNSEWVSPIVVVPKKVGADGKVKIQVC